MAASGPGASESGNGGKEGGEEPVRVARSLSWSSIAKSLLAGGVAGGVCVSVLPQLPAAACQLGM